MNTLDAGSGARVGVGTRTTAGTRDLAGSMAADVTTAGKGKPAICEVRSPTIMAVQAGL